MKSISWMLLLAAGLNVAVSCKKEQKEKPKDGTLAVSATLVAEDASSAIHGGTFAWGTADSLFVMDSRHYMNKFFLAKGGGTATATFQGEVSPGSKVSNLALWPARPGFSWSDSRGLTVYMPPTYASPLSAQTPRLACFSSLKGTLRFRYIAGLLRIRIKDVPALARSLRISSKGTKLSGNFRIQDPAVAGSCLNVSSTTSADTVLTVSIPDHADPADYTFEVSLPVGNYPRFDFSLCEEDGAVISRGSVGSTVISRGAVTPLDNVTMKQVSMHLRVMSFNIRYAGNSEDNAAGNGWDDRKASCVSMVNDLQPDLLGLQEPKPVQWNYLKNSLSDYQIVTVTHPTNNSSSYPSNTGNTVLMFRKTTLDLLQYGYFYYGEDPTKPAIPYGSDDKNYRCCVWVKVKTKLTGHVVWFYTTHFPYDPNGSSSGSYNVEPRTKCAQQMVATMKAATGEDGICFTCGDLNCSFSSKITSPSLTPLSNWLQSARQTAPVKDNWRSFNGFKPVQTGGEASIDHIFYRNATPLSYATVIDGYGAQYLSDHFPILFICRLEAE